MIVYCSMFSPDSLGNEKKNLRGFTPGLMNNFFRLTRNKYDNKNSFHTYCPVAVNRHQTLFYLTKSLEAVEEC